MTPSNRPQGPDTKNIPANSGRNRDSSWFSKIGKSLAFATALAVGAAVPKVGNTQDTPVAEAVDNNTTTTTTTTPSTPAVTTTQAPADSTFTKPVTTLDYNDPNQLGNGIAAVVQKARVAEQLKREANADTDGTVSVKKVTSSEAAYETITNADGTPKVIRADFRTAIAQSRDANSMVKPGMLNVPRYSESQVAGQTVHIDTQVTDQILRDPVTMAPVSAANLGTEFTVAADPDYRIGTFEQRGDGSRDTTEIIVMNVVGANGTVYAVAMPYINVNNIPQGDPAATAAKLAGVEAARIAAKEEAGRIHSANLAAAEAARIAAEGVAAEAARIAAEAARSATTGSGAGAVDATTGSGAGAVDATTGSGAGAVDATTGSGAGAVDATTGSGAGAVDATTGSGAGAVDATTGSGAGAVDATTGSGAGAVDATTGSGARPMIFTEEEIAEGEGSGAVLGEGSTKTEVATEKPALFDQLFENVEQFVGFNVSYTTVSGKLSTYTVVGVTTNSQGVRQVILSQLHNPRFRFKLNEKTAVNGGLRLADKDPKVIGDMSEKVDIAQEDPTVDTDTLTDAFEGRVRDAVTPFLDEDGNLRLLQFNFGDSSDLIRNINVEPTTSIQPNTIPVVSSIGSETTSTRLRNLSSVDQNEYLTRTSEYDAEISRVLANLATQTNDEQQRNKFNTLIDELDGSYGRFAAAYAAIEPFRQAVPEVADQFGQTYFPNTYRPLDSQNGEPVITVTGDTVVPEDRYATPAGEADITRSEMDAVAAENAARDASGEGSN